MVLQMREIIDTEMCFLNNIIRKLLAFILVCIFFNVVGLHSPVCAQVSVEIAYPNLNFNQPVDYLFADENSNDVFVVERIGQVHKFANIREVSNSEVVLDLSDVVSIQGEGGLLGVAFHPNFPENPEAFAYYTPSNPFRSVLSRFQVDTTTMEFNMASEEVLLEQSQPFNNHNGGQLRFGPDGMLYLSLGDGGGAGDPQENGQDRTTLLGSIIRIDIDSKDEGLNYSIPDDNPYVGNSQGFREEIYAYGLRNPFRFSFDAETGDLWVADVGQNRLEEVDVIKAGSNYGWNIMEGTECFGSSSCNKDQFELPVFEYSHDIGESITGGFVYRGEDVPELSGAYVYADFVVGTVWSFEYDGSNVSNQMVLGELGSNSVVGFGEDQQRELYICSFDGFIYTFSSESATALNDENTIPHRVTLFPNYPNPFNPATTISFELSEPRPVELTVYNSRGQEIANLLNQTMSSGRHDIRFDAGDLASGIYFYTLKTGNTQQTRRMTLIK